MPTTSKPAPRRSRSKGKPRGAEGTTSALIYEAAEILFYERGYNGTSLRDIADAVGIQVGSLYNHIESKEQLLVEIMKTSMTGLLASVGAATENVADPVDQLRAFMNATIVFHGENARISLIGNTELRSLPEQQFVVIQRLRDEYEHRLIFLLEQCRKDGVEIPDTKLAAYSAVAICSYVSSWYRPDGRLNLHEIAEHLTATFAPLMSTDDRESKRAS